MSEQQRAAVDAMLRSIPPTPADAPIAEVRAGYDAIMTRDVPDDVRTAPVVLGGRPALELTPERVRDDEARLLYLHGGSFVMGSPAAYAGFTAQFARRIGVRTVSLDYRLAPEHRFPAAVEDCLAAYRELLDQGVPAEKIVLAGDSAGGNLTLVTLISARRAGLPMPAAAAVLSALTDFTASGASMENRDGLDPIFRTGFLDPVRANYLNGQDPRAELASPYFADLTGLPPLLVTIGSHELLLDDAVNFAGRAGAAGVDVTLEITAGVPHVFQSMFHLMDEADEGVDRIARFLGRHLAKG